MVSVTKEMWTETGHRLTDYDGKCAHLHGHSYRWLVTVSGELDPNGLLIDFKDLKRIMADKIDAFFDHAFILHDQDPLVRQFMRQDGNWQNGILKLLRATNGESPRIQVVPWNPTVENMARFVFQEIQDALSGWQLAVDEVKVWETHTSYATVREL